MRKYLVNLRRSAKPLQLPEERETYHVPESEKPAAALVDCARMNDVDQILIRAQRRACAPVSRRFRPGRGRGAVQRHGRACAAGKLNASSPQMDLQ